MAPVEIETISRDVITPSAYMKIVDKAFELPLVTDTFNEVSKLAQPLSPYVETMKNIATPYVEKFSPMVESGFITIKTAADLQFPEGTTDNIQCKFDSVKEQVTSAVENLDTLVCQGLDQLTTRVPALKEPTTELVETTRVSFVILKLIFYSSFIFRILPFLISGMPRNTLLALVSHRSLSSLVTRDSKSPQMLLHSQASKKPNLWNLL